MTMVPAQNLISKQQQHNNHLFRHLHHHKGIISSSPSSSGADLYYGGCGGGTNTNEYTTDESLFGGLTMSRKLTPQGYDYCSPTDQSCVGSDNLVVGDHQQYHQYPMADDQDESRTNSLNNDAASTNSLKEEVGGGGVQDLPERESDDHEGWLQLSIGGHTGITQQNKTPPPPPPPPPHHHPDDDHQVLLEPAAFRRGGGGNAIELELLPSGGAGIRSSASTAMFEGASHDHLHHQHHQIGGIPSRGPTMTNFGSGTNFSTTSLMYFQQYYPGSSSTSNFPRHQEAVNNWTFRPLIAHHPHPQYHVSASSSASPSSSLLMPLPPHQLGSTPTPTLTTSTSYLARHFQLQPPAVDAATAAGPSVDFRVVNPPRRPHSGIWFMLQASQNQAKEPFLPQISKSFLRIKDGRMTVGLITKYLVNKLRLDSESEIEITCRGQELRPYLTLQHVRDNIWAPTTLTLLPPDSSSSSSTTDHVMVLHYSRSTTP